MVNCGRIEELAVPPKGKLTRLKIAVNTAADTATKCRVIISERGFSQSLLGYNALKGTYKYHLWDSNIAGTKDISINSTGVKIDRIFEDGGLDYENHDDEGTDADMTAKTVSKNGKLYAYIETDSVDTALHVEVDVKAQEKA